MSSIQYIVVGWECRSVGVRTVWGLIVCVCVHEREGRREGGEREGRRGGYTCVSSSIINCTLKKYKMYVH